MQNSLEPLSPSRNALHLSQTEKALISRLIDGDLAFALYRAGWTLGKLQQQPDEKLRELGLSDFSVAELRDTARPPIPPSTLTRLLYENRFTCCVCRDASRAVVVHHIQPWAESFSHEIQNLAVVCQECHNKAHSVSSITQNLDAAKLFEFKKSWERDVARLDATAIMKASRDHGDAWVYFNHLRLFELAKSLKIDFHKLQTYQRAASAKIIDATGELLPRSNTLSYMYDDASCLSLYAYARDVLIAVLARLSVSNLSDAFDVSSMRAIVNEGDFILMQGRHRFKRKDGRRDHGRGQIVTGVRKANGVAVRFSFDRWEATSTSAWSGWLSGSKRVTSLVRAGTILEEGKTFVVEATVFAIAQGFSEFQQRDYLSASTPLRDNFSDVAVDDDDWLYDLE